MATAGPPSGRRPGRRPRPAEVGHVLDRDDDVDLDRLGDPGVDDRDVARRRRAPTSRRGSGRPPPAGAGWPTARCAAGGGPVTSSSRSSDTARWAPRLVAAMAWISSMITVSTLDQRLGGVRREHQVQALGRRDEQVGRPARASGGPWPTCHRCAWPPRERAPTDPCQRDSGEALGGEGDARQGRPQVLLDVERQRPQRRDVEDAGTRRVVGRRRRDEPVDRRQERRQRLAAAGGRADQRVVTGRDRRPALDLGLGRRRERRGEPCPHGRRERRRAPDDLRCFPGYRRGVTTR